MDSDSAARLLYLSLVIVFLGGSLFVAERRNLGRMVRYALIWVLIIAVATLIAYGAFQIWPGLAQF